MAQCLVSNSSAPPNQFPIQTIGTGTNGSNRFGSANNSGSTTVNDENRKLFLGGLSWETEEKDLYDYFQQFGQIDKVTIKYNPNTGRSRGFGFVTFVNDDTVDSVLKTGPHIIKNRTVDPKRPKGKSGLKKIFVGGIDCDMTNDEIKAHFQQFGPIENIERPFDRQRNRSREFCFIIFESGEAAESAISLPKQVIGNKECDIKMAHPNRNQQHGNNGMGGMSGGMNSVMQHRRNGGPGAGGPLGPSGPNGFFKNRSSQNMNSNWRNMDHHQNGGHFRGAASNGDNRQYSDALFLTSFDTIPPSNNYSSYKAPFTNSYNMGYSWN